MIYLNRLRDWYDDAKANKWYRYFAIFCRVTLATGFIISGIVKIKGERFAAGLPVNNPMGHYLEALYHTGFYYTFIGIAQLLIALLLLIPRTALLGALLYFPIILNVCILAHAVRFEGTRVTLFMLLANVYLLCWDYDRIKHILPFKQPIKEPNLVHKKPANNKFPFLFFGAVFTSMLLIVVGNLYLYDIRPGNAQDECVNGCPGNSDPKACDEFCDCIYIDGKPLEECLARYHEAKAKHLREK